MPKSPTYYDIWKTKTHVYYLGERGVEVILYPDGMKRVPRLTGDERKELDLRVRVDKLLSKVSANKLEFTELWSIPDKIGIGFLPYYSNMTLVRLRPEALKNQLIDHARYHGLLRRG